MMSMFSSLFVVEASLKFAEPETTKRIGSKGIYQHVFCMQVSDINV